MAWFNTLWANRKKLTIDNTKVSGSSTLSGFPILISVTDTDLQKARTDGFDFVITTNNQVTKIPHEIEKWEQTTGELVLWFKGDLQHNSDTDFYIYYNNPASMDQQDSTNVWDSNYDAVWHLSETPGGADSIKDSTSNAFHGTPTGTVQLAGKMDGSLDFDFVDDIIIADPGPTTNQAVANTMSCWFYAHTIDSGGLTMMSSSNSDTYMAVKNVTTDRVGNGWGGSIPSAGVNTTGISLNTWHYAVFTHDGSGNLKLYLDNNAQVTDTETVLNRNVSIIRLGGNFPDFWDGQLDECRISNIERSDDWRLTEFANQGTPSTFMTFATEELLPSGSGSAGGSQQVGVSLVKKQSEEPIIPPKKKTIQHATFETVSVISTPLTESLHTTSKLTKDMVVKATELKSNFLVETYNELKSRCGLYKKTEKIPLDTKSNLLHKSRHEMITKGKMDFTKQINRIKQQLRDLDLKTYSSGDSTYAQPQ